MIRRKKCTLKMFLPAAEIQISFFSDIVCLPLTPITQSKREKKVDSKARKTKFYNHKFCLTTTIKGVFDPVNLSYYVLFDS